MDRLSCLLLLLSSNYVRAFVLAPPGQTAGTRSRRTTTTTHGALVNGDLPTTTTTNNDVPMMEEGFFFRTPPTPVYIADTDAYGIIYNTNYVLFYERALLSQPAVVQGFASNNDDYDDNKHGPIVVSMDTIKFKASPALGDFYVIEGTLKESSRNHQVWDLVMKSSPNHQDDNDATTVYNVASGFVLANNKESQEKHMKPVPDATTTTTTPWRVDTFPVFRDEFDLDETLPLRNYLNYFEKSRSNSLGGPIGLKSLQDQGIIVVVTSMKGSHLFLSEHPPAMLRPGCEIQSHLDFVVKRLGSVVECKQMASLLLVDGKEERLAQSTITMMMLDAQTMRPTTKLPPILLKQMGQ